MVEKPKLEIDLLCGGFIISRVLIVTYGSSSDPLGAAAFRRLADELRLRAGGGL